MEDITKINRQIEVLEELLGEYGHKTLSNVHTSLKAVKSHIERKENSTKGT